MMKNQDDVAFTTNVDCGWRYIVEPEVELISESLEKLLATIDTTLDCLSDLYRPTMATGMVLGFESDGKLMLTFGVDPVTEKEFELHDEAGISGKDVRNAVNGVDIPDECIRYLQLARVPKGAIRVHLSDGEHWVDMDSGYYRSYNRKEPLDSRPGRDPLTLDIAHYRSLDRMETMYEIAIWSNTDLWFAETESGKENRHRMSSVLTRLKEAVEPVEIDIYADGAPASIMQQMVEIE